MKKLKPIELTVDRYITDARRSLNAHIKRAIHKNLRIHIDSPVGSGKTTYALEIIEKYKNQYQFLLLEPQISISSQQKVKMLNKNLPVFVLNSDTKKSLLKWEDQNQMCWDETYISTIDSAWWLFEDERLDPDKTVVLVDESHTFLSDARKDFDKTVSCIIESKCPVIGFSATASYWVLDYVFKMQQHIRISVRTLPNKIVMPFKITNAPSTIANVINKFDLNKVVIFTDIKKEFQNRIKTAIQEELPELNVHVLNADTRDEDEKQAWDHLMKNDELYPGTNVVIINKVAQAGININDKNIDLVILYEKFDPLGFQQYLGRCRYYRNEYHYLFLDYGKDSTNWKCPKDLDNFIIQLKNDLKDIDNESIKLLKRISADINLLYKEMPDGTFDVNRCIAAQSVYKEFRELHAIKLIEFLKGIAPNIYFDAIYSEPIYDIILAGTAAEERQKIRKKHNDKLPSFIKKYFRYLEALISLIAPNWNHDDAKTAVENSTTDKKEAKKKGVLYVPRTRVKGILECIEASRKANHSSFTKVLLAAKYYNLSNKDPKVLDGILKLGERTIKKHLGANKFFNEDFQNTSIIKVVLDDLKDNEISETHTKDYWLNLICSKLNILLGHKLAQMLFDYCMIIDKSRASINGQRATVLTLINVVYSYSEYRVAHKLDKLFGKT